jgi:hypothetical protein
MSSYDFGKEPSPSFSQNFHCGSNPAQEARDCTCTSILLDLSNTDGTIMYKSRPTSLQADLKHPETYPLHGLASSRCDRDRASRSDIHNTFRHSDSDSARLCIRTCRGTERSSGIRIGTIKLISVKQHSQKCSGRIGGLLTWWC